MKHWRHRSTAGLALALGATAAVAQTQNQIYGLLVESINTSKTGNTRTNYVDDNGSRLGFRGVEPIGGLNAMYGLELGFDMSDGNAMTPNFRTSYVGLGGAWGTMAMGRLDSANPTNSPIYSQFTSIVNFAPNDSGATAIGAPIVNGRNRVSNAIGYKSPASWGPVTFRARYYLRGVAPAADNEVVDKQGSSLDLGVVYASGPLTTGLAYGHDSRKGGQPANEMRSKWQTGVRYSFGLIEPYVLYGRESYVQGATSRDTVDYWIIGAKFASGPHAVVVNVMERDIQLSRLAVRKKQQASYSYALSKRTELQFFADRDNVDTTKPNVTKMTYAAGIRHGF